MKFFLLLGFVFVVKCESFQFQQRSNNNGGPRIYSFGGTGNQFQSLPTTSTGTNGNSRPWGSHFVDFSERYPNHDDQLGIDSRQHPQQQHQQQQWQQNNNRVRVDSRQTFPPSSSFFIPQQGRTRDGSHPLINVFTPALFGNKPWWKGANVCIKREEQDGKVNNLNPTIATSMRGNPGFSTLSTFSSQNRDPSSTTSAHGHPVLNMQLSTCEERDTTHICKTQMLGPGLNNTVTTTYECCIGYVLDERTQECVRGRYENIFSTMEALGTSEFLQLIKASGLIQKVETEPLTIFVPIDEAVKAARRASTSNHINIIPRTTDNELIRRRRNVYLHDAPPPSASGRDSQLSTGHNHYDQQQQYLEALEDGDETGAGTEHRGDSPIMEMDLSSDSHWRQTTLDQQDEYRRSTHYDTAADDRNPTTSSVDTQNMVLSHMIQNSIRTDDFVDEKVLYSENRDSVIRMNTWTVAGEKMNTVNCARLTSVNHRCSNGVIHLIDRQLSPVTKTTAEIIAHDPNFSLLYSLLRTSGLLAQFQDARAHLTLLAFTNEAARALDRNLLTRMQSGDTCLKRILQHHIVPITFCSSVIIKSGQIRNLNHIKLSIERNAEDVISINGSNIVTRDIVTKNGVIHVIDKVLYSENDEPLESALRREGLTSFLQSLQQARISLSELTNVTIFAPSNAAFETTLPSEIKNDPQRLRQVLEYHIATSETQACHFQHQQEISTKLESRSIRMNLYSNFPLGVEAEVTAQCGRVTQVNRQACNGIIHVIDRVLIPSTMDVAQLLRTQADFTVWNRLIADSGMIDILRQTGPITLFGIPDAVFYKLPRDKLESILNDREVATQLLKSHIISESLCCTGVLPSTWFLTKRVRNLNGQNVPVTRNSNGEITYGNVKISTCDLTASNGIIHIVTEIFQETSSHAGLMGSCLPTTIEISSTTDVMALFFRG